MENKVLKTHHFTFNKKDNGGEQLTLTTKFVDNGDAGDSSIYTNQVLSLQSYGNCASIELYGSCITPEMLRQLAKELDVALTNARAEKVACTTKMPVREK